MKSRKSDWETIEQKEKFPQGLSAALLEGGEFGLVDLNSWSEIGQVMVDLDIGAS